MEQKFFFEEEDPQPYPEDIQEVLKEEVKPDRAPKCVCHKDKDDECLC